MIDQTVVDFIYEQSKKGVGRDKIVEQLRQMKIPEEDIQKAINFALQPRPDVAPIMRPKPDAPQTPQVNKNSQGQNPSNPPQGQVKKSGHGKIILIIVLMLILILAGGAAFFLFGTETGQNILGSNESSQGGDQNIIVLGGGETNQERVEEELTFDETCEMIKGKLEICGKYYCKITDPFSNDEVRYEVMGYENEKCLFYQETSESSTSCLLDTGQRSLFGDYILSLSTATEVSAKVDASPSEESAIEYHNGKEVVNPLNSALKDKSCDVYIYADEADFNTEEFIEEIQNSSEQNSTL